MVQYTKAIPVETEAARAEYARWVPAPEPLVFHGDDKSSIVGYLQEGSGPGRPGTTALHSTIPRCSTVPAQVAWCPGRRAREGASCSKNKASRSVTHACPSLPRPAPHAHSHPAARALPMGASKPFPKAEQRKAERSADLGPGGGVIPLNGDDRGSVKSGLVLVPVRGQAVTISQRDHFSSICPRGPVLLRSARKECGLQGHVPGALSAAFCGSHHAAKQGTGCSCSPRDPSWHALSTSATSPPPATGRPSSPWSYFREVTAELRHLSLSFALACNASALLLSVQTCS